MSVELGKHAHMRARAGLARETRFMHACVRKSASVGFTDMNVLQRRQLRMSDAVHEEMNTIV